MSTDRNTSPLGKICGIALGATPERKSPRYWDTEKSTENVWLSIGDMPKVLHAVAYDSKEYLSDEGVQAKGRIVKAGTLLVSFKLTLGRLAYAGRDLFTNEAIAALTILEPEQITKEYLYWYLTFFDWNAYAKHDEKLKGKTLNKAKLKVIPVLVPLPSEQERIVAMLDDAFAAIYTAVANTEMQLSLLEDLKRSTLQQTFCGEHSVEHLSEAGG